MEPIMTLIIALLALFLLLMWMAIVDDREARQRQREIFQDPVWTRPANPTDISYNGWLAEQGLPPDFPPEALERMSYVDWLEWTGKAAEQVPPGEERRESA